MTCNYVYNFILYAVQVMFYLCVSVCLSVCPSFRLLATSQNMTDQIFMKTLPLMYLWTKKNSLDLIYNWIWIQEILKDPFPLQDMACSTLGSCLWKTFGCS